MRLVALGASKHAAPSAEWGCVRDRVGTELGLVAWPARTRRERCQLVGRGGGVGSLEVWFPTNACRFTTTVKLTTCELSHH